MRFWCDMSMECVRRDHTPDLSAGDQRGPFLTARALGMALAALHDGHAIAEGGAGLLQIVPPPGLAAAGAALAPLAGAAACAQVLRLRYPNQSHLLEPAWTNWVAHTQTVATSAAARAAEAAGRAYGTLVHRWGISDPAAATGNGYMPSGANYAHIAPPTQPMQGYAGGQWGKEATPLLVQRPAFFAPPPGRVSPIKVEPTQHYRDDFARVAAKGKLDRSPAVNGERTLAEEVIGIAWGYDGPNELGTPPRLYLQVVLTVLDQIEASAPGALSANEELAILAGAAIAMADAGIHAWYYKYSPDHMMWRPAVGIRQAVPGNGAADPDFLPLGRPDTNGSGVGLTPDFPAYPSGHATFGAAAFQLLRLFLVQKGLATFTAEGVDDIRFSFVSDEFDGRNKDPRTRQPRDHITLGLDSLWQAIVDNSVSRVYLGVHWQFDGITTRNAAGTEDQFGLPATPSMLGHTGGVWLGAQIANEMAARLGVTDATVTASRMT